MKAPAYNLNPRGKPEREGVPHGADPYWKRAHRDWRFWIGFTCMLAAIGMYVMSDNLAMIPRFHRPPPLAGGVRK
jgi:hypothetical protein